ncbi:MAG: DUF4338 domain-containing protein [Deltaproteobacteria bacterium]|nr:DUF4338 domain-containing protein [Deltaproteobacteria bacterium]
MPILTKFLNDDMDNLITLPALPAKTNKPRPETDRPIAAPTFEVCLDLREIPVLRFVLVETGEQSSLWRRMIRQFHYIKSSALFGAQLRYLVYGEKSPESSDGTSNPTSEPHLLAGLGFGASAWRLSCRDKFIGWTNEQRVTNLNLVVGVVRDFRPTG